MMTLSRSAVRTASAALVLAAGLGVAVARTGALHASPSAGTSARVPSDRWLEGLTAPHKQFFDAPSADTGIALVHVMNYYDTYNKAYGVKDADVDAVLTFYGGSTFYALNDTAWAKYQLGEFLGAKDPTTGMPATRNPWRESPVVLGLTLPQASIVSLHKRGATMIVCNNALQIFVGLLAAKRGLNAESVYDDLKANILPEVNLVPAMVIAVEQATRAGLTYHRQ